MIVFLINSFILFNIYYFYHQRKQLIKRDESLITVHVEFIVSHQMSLLLSKGSKMSRLDLNGTSHRVGKSKKELCMKISNHRKVDKHNDRHHILANISDLFVLAFISQYSEKSSPFGYS